jgi:hypothetical protein
MRFAGVDIAAEAHTVAVMGEKEVLLVKPTVFGEDADGYAKLDPPARPCRGHPDRDGGNGALLEEHLRDPGRWRLPRLDQSSANSTFCSGGSGADQDRRYRCGGHCPLRRTEATCRDSADLDLFSHIGGFSGGSGA